MGGLGWLIEVRWHNPVCAILGVSIMSIQLVINFFFFPNQMLTLNSSKQIGFLDGIRLKSLFVLAGYCVFFALIGVVLSIAGGMQKIPHIFLTLFFMVSIFLMVIAWVASRWPQMQTIIYLFTLSLKDSFLWLMSIDLFMIVVLSILVWIVYSYWWFNWRPKKFHKNIYGMKPEDMMRMQAERQYLLLGGLRNVAKAKPRTLIGTFLLGRADGVGAEQIKTACMILFFFVVVFQLFFMLGELNKFLDAVRHSGATYIYIIYVTFAFALIANLFRNLHKVWMYFSGPRHALFFRVEQFYFQRLLGLMLPLMMVHFLISYFVNGNVQEWIYIPVIVLFALLVCALALYLGLYVYQKTHANVVWISWINGALIVLSTIPVGIFLSVDTNIRFEFLPAVLVVILSIFCAVLLLRIRVKALWSRINLVRVKN